ncbi:MAG: hypothetical protein J6B71_01445 [Clostridia bacterium]|nr:hypothetical protein [Clostridia bacterium]
MKKTLLRLTALLTACLLLLLTATACASQGKALLTLEKDGIKVSLSVNLYQLMLSRAKGNLVANGITANGITADQDAFWNYSAKFDGENIQTQDEYYLASVLNTCRNYLVVLYLFEKEGLTLSSAAEEEIEDRLEELILTDGEGSKTKLNALLSTYGVNYNMIKEAYLLEAKADAVRTHLFGTNASLVDKQIKDEYLNENYVHFRQIFLANYDYVYETDEFVDVILYQTETGKTNRVYYDTENGVAGKNADGTSILDDNGDVVYFIKDSNQTEIAYNPKGEPNRLLTADGKSYQTKKMTVEELEALTKRAEELCASLQGASSAKFEEAIAKESTDTVEESEYDDGYYLQKNYDYSAMGNDYAHLETVVEKLNTMQVGDVALVAAPTGYNIIMKYAHTDAAYEKEQNESWASTFYADLVEELFLDRCQALYDNIVLNTELLATVPSMKEIVPNYYY